LRTPFAGNHLEVLAGFEHTWNADEPAGDSVVLSNLTSPNFLTSPTIAVDELPIVLPGDVFGLLDNAFGLLINKLLEVLDLQPPPGEQSFHAPGPAERQSALEEHAIKAGNNPRDPIV
jgi:hypothetical protein